MAFEYTQLTTEQQSAIINQRIRELEQAHLQLFTRLAAPDPGIVVSDLEKQQLTSLEENIATLKAALPAQAA